MSNVEALERYRSMLVDMLLKANGPLLHGDVLRHLLGFESGGAMRSALSRELLPVTLVELPYRQGKFALSEEVATWLFDQRIKRISEPPLILNPLEAVPSSKLKEYIEFYGFLLHEEKIMDLLKIDSRKELMIQYKKKSLPFTVFQLDNRRTKIFTLLLEVIPYLESIN
jgi:hypothetical protein